MSGIGKWIKKHPKESIALLALATGGIAAAPALGAAAAGAGAAGAAGAGAAGAGTALGLGGGTASLFGTGAATGLLAPTAVAGMGGGTASLFGAEAGLGAGLLAPTASTPTLATIAAEAPLAGGSRLAGVQDYLKLAQQANELGGEQRQEQPMPLQLRGPGQPLQATPMYGSDLRLEDERRRRLWEAQQGYGYGSY